MNYYIQGNKEKADQIKAAFEKLGIDVLDFGFAEKTVVYCSIGGCVVQYLPYSINLMNILHSHPDYQELELPKPHYDISNFKPYQKVLIRFGNNDTWRADFFSHIKEDRGRYFVGIGYANKQCIPFEGNEHLLGTTDMCDEMYINW